MKKIMMVMPVMRGGGAERVAAQLMNEFYKQGHDVKFLLTSSKEDEVIRTDLNEEIPLILLQEEINVKNIPSGIKVLRLISSALCKPYESMGKEVPAKLAYWSFISQYYREVEYLREVMKNDPELRVLSFLQPSIPIAAIAGKDLPNRIIFSERGNPERLMKHRYGRRFIKKYYQGISGAAFQTEDAKRVYPKYIGDKGVVISNPIKGDLPEPYTGERDKYITTYCRISKQKNLPLLLKSFALLSKEYPKYMLKIVGDSFNDEGDQVIDELKHLMIEYNLQDKVVFLPFSENVHNEILKDAMYVNSSDYEGISNAMIEAMAIGVPVVCTDCPIGGAKAVIKNYYNGILVPVGDSEELYKAMKFVIENTESAFEIGHNATKIREELSLQLIAEKWMELL